MHAGCALTDAHAVAIGARVRELRRARGMSQRVLADRVGMHRPNLSRLENGRCDSRWGYALPKLQTLLDVAQGLGVPVSQIVSALDEEVSGDR